MTEHDLSGWYDPPTVPHAPHAERFALEVVWPEPADDPDHEVDEPWGRGVL